MKKIFFFIFIITLVAGIYNPAIAEEKSEKEKRKEIIFTLEMPIRFPSEISKEGKIFDNTCTGKCLIISKNNKFSNATYLDEALLTLFAYMTDKYYPETKWNDLKIEEISIRNNPDTSIMEIDFKAYGGRSPTKNQILIEDLLYINSILNSISAKIPDLINEKLGQQEGTTYMYAPVKIMFTKEKATVDIKVAIVNKPPKATPKTEI